MPEQWPGEATFKPALTGLHTGLQELLLSQISLSNSAKKGKSQQELSHPPIPMTGLILE